MAATPLNVHSFIRIQRDRSQSTVVRIICCDLCLNFLKCSKSRCAHELTAAIASFTDINVSQGSVATLFRCCGIINKHFIANFPQSVTVKEFLKSVNIWRKYGQKLVACFFDSQCIQRTNERTNAPTNEPTNTRDNNSSCAHACFESLIHATGQVVSGCVSASVRQ